MIRAALFAAAVTAALSTPAMAQNLSSISNTAAGVGNVARQGAFVGQRSGGLFAGGSIANIGNTAAGVGNTASQSATVLQRSGGRLPFGGPNLANLSNLSAGVGNFAGQSAFVRQR